MHEQQADAAVAIADEALADLAALDCRRVEAASALIRGGLAELESVRLLQDQENCADCKR
jgi:hypothetical protein